MIMQFINTRIIKLLTERIHSSHIDSVVGVVVGAGGGGWGGHHEQFIRDEAAPRQPIDRHSIRCASLMVLVGLVAVAERRRFVTSLVMMIISLHAVALHFHVDQARH